MSAKITVRGTQLHVSDIAEPQAFGINCEVSNFLDGAVFTAGPHTEALAPGCELARTDGEIAAQQQVPQCRDVYTVGGEAIRPEQYANFAWIHAMQFNTRNTFDSLQAAFQEAIKQVVTVRQVALTGYSQLQYGLVAERTGKHQYATDIVRELISYAIDLGARFDALGPHVLIPVELQKNLRLAFAGTGEHSFDAGQGCESLFNRSRDEPLHFFRCRTFIRNLYEDARKFDVRKFFQRQQP